MTHLIISCDGTWNTTDQWQDDVPAPTNVVRLHNALAHQTAAGIEQRRYYHPGVGTEGSALARFAGGAFGAGISANIKSAYRWLAANYQAGDLIFLFGFSRGAFTARSLGGLIGACGLPDLTGLTSKEGWARIDAAYDRYRQPAPRPDIPWKRLASPAADGSIPIQMIGVWDTVGALGIPDDLVLLNLLDDPKKWSFHDTGLGSQVKFARHAVAIDEQRASFTPTFWTDAHDDPLDDGDRVKQLWFPGVHSDVGGGYGACGLSNGALLWMMAEATRAGLAFDPEFQRQITPDFRGTLHDSLAGPFKSMRSRPRNRPELKPGSPHYHESVLHRTARPPITQCPYLEPTVNLAVGQTSAPRAIYARNHWNPTGLFLVAGGTYEFTAEGEWIDGGVTCDPAGHTDGKFRLSSVTRLLGTALGQLELGFRKLSGNKAGEFFGTRRVESANWFALIGAIANDGPDHGTNPNSDGSPWPHQTFVIGQGPTVLTIGPTEAGYLYAFANDAWHSYGNNRGCVTLRVKRTG